MRDESLSHGILTEAERNRVLRRADWRFLLPDAAPARAVSFAEGSLHEAVSVAAGIVHRPAGIERGGYDLAVATDPSPDTTRRALKLLRPGGALYTEWTGARALSPGWVRRSLARSGAQSARLYWPWPWPTVRSTRYWLPLDSPGAAVHMRSREAPARQPILRAGGRWLNVCERALLGAGVRYPLSAIVLAGTHADHARTGHRADALDARWPGLPYEIASAAQQAGCLEPGAHASWLLLTPGPRTVSKVVGIVLTGSPERPSCAVKMAREPEAEAGLEREAEALRSLRAVAPAAAGPAPELLFSVQTRTGLALGERARTGRPLWRVADRSSQRAIALELTDWLIRLVHGRPVARGWQEALIKRVLDEFVGMFGEVADPELVRHTRALLQTTPPLPATFEHRDLGPWNVLVEPTGFAVLDWESSERDGLPALDLLYFLAYHAFFVEDAMHNARTLPVFRASLDPATKTGRIGAECLERYAQHIGLAPDALPPLRLLVWMIHSRSDYRHYTGDVGGRPPADLLRNSFFLRLWNEEARSLMKVPTPRHDDTQVVRS